jgi:hypothetical protein
MEIDPRLTYQYESTAQSVVSEWETASCIEAVAERENKTIRPHSATDEREAFNHAT